jgi:transcription elongation factor Elf1
MAIDMTPQKLAADARMVMTDKRANVTSTEHTPCPHCGHNDDGGTYDDPGPWDCPACGKSFMFDVTEGGEMQTVALMTFADMEYLKLMGRA